VIELPFKSRLVLLENVRFVLAVRGLNNNDVVVETNVVEGAVSILSLHSQRSQGGALPEAVLLSKYAVRRLRSCVSHCPWHEDG
jgi:hypothetical protein